MPMPSEPFNPYESPVPVASSSDGMPPLGRRRPGGLTAIAVIAIILGSLGLIGSLFGLASFALQPVLRSAFTLPAGLANDPAMKAQRDMQREMQEKMQAVTDRYAPFTVGFAVINLFLAGSLLLGGIWILKIQPKGYAVLTYAFLIAIIFEIIRAIVQTFMQVELGTVMASIMPEMMKAAGPKAGQGAAQGAEFIAMATKIGIAVGVVFAIVPVLAKLVYYIIGVVYLRRPQIRQLFEPRY
jgi:hypothetical protein